MCCLFVYRGFTRDLKGNNKKPFIDHFILTKNLNCKLLEFSTLDDIQNPSEHIHNPSDHLPICCILDCNVFYNDPVLPSHHTSRPVWDSASDDEIQSYKDCLDIHLLSIPVPTDIIYCDDYNCDSHNNEITQFHDRIVDALQKASEESIPV